MSAASKRHMSRVARVPCVLCAHQGLGQTPALVHHMKLGTGASDRASAEKHDVKPGALRRYIAALEGDKIDEAAAEAADLERLIEAGP